MRRQSFSIVLICGVLLFWGNQSRAQDLPTSTIPSVPTSTPIQVRISTSTPIPIFTTPTPTISTNLAIATPQDRILMEPLSEVNVRSSPEITENNRIGAIRAGERFVVLGQYFNWIQFQYDQVPSNRGWVYADLVEVIQGDPATIPTVVIGATETPDLAVAASTETRQAILDAPGGVLTITAQSRIIQLPDGTPASQNQIVVAPNETVLPTFTYPPNVSLRTTVEPSTGLVAAPAIQQSSTGDGTSGFPPIIPIGILGGFGLLGLAVSVLRG